MQIPINPTPKHAGNPPQILMEWSAEIRVIQVAQVALRGDSGQPHQAFPLKPRHISCDINV